MSSPWKKTNSPAVQTLGCVRPQSSSRDTLGSLLGSVERVAAGQCSPQKNGEGYTNALRAARDALTAADRTILKLQGEKAELIRRFNEVEQEHGADQLALRQAWKEIDSLRKECNALNTKNEILQQRLEEKEKDKIECASIHT